MPPANSPRNSSPPADSNSRPWLPPSYFSALQELESPVLNLAATLTTQGEEDIITENSQYFPREDGANLESWQQRSDRERTRQRQRVDVDQRDRLRRVMNRLSRIQDPRPAYGDRVPSQNNLYDWSPAHEADDEDELDQILAELRREQPNTHPDILRVLGRSQLDAERETRSQQSYSSRLMSSNQPSQSVDGSLRSAAILQSVRRHPNRFSARTRDHILSDRDSATRSPHQSDSRHRNPLTENARQAALQRLRERRPSTDRTPTTRDRDRDMMSRVDSFRRNYLDRTPSTSMAVSPALEQTIVYLSRIRWSNNIYDSVECSLDAGLSTKDDYWDEKSDFILDTLTLPPPAESSWLAPGAVLSGCQHATTTVTSTLSSGAPAGGSTTLYRLRNSESLSSTLFDSSRPWQNSSYTPLHRSSLQPSAAEVVTSHSPQQDRWPVKVTIHAVDYEKMSLSATMEAYNVPSHPHSQQSVLNGSADTASTAFTRTSSITTYLEGEILDFNTFTLLTESFKSSALNDATYWRKLPPFQKFSDADLVKNLTSRRFFTEVLNRDWILMRWKERCFVKTINRGNAVQDPENTLSSRPTDSFISTSSSQENHEPREGFNSEHTTFDDSGCGLTISGFYYVCLRRSDGKLEGLYYDPQSSPYQCLKLESVNGGVFPSWSFR